MQWMKWENSPTSTWEISVTVQPHQEKQYYDIWHYQEKEKLQNQQ